MTEGLELWLIRHGETHWNREGRTQGQSQNPLSELGVKQARRLGMRLEAETFGRVYSSDLKRALQTAALALPDAEIIQDERLREIGSGIFEGTTDAERSAAQRQQLQRIREDRRVRRPPGGENYEDVALRLEAWLSDLPAEGRIAAFTHGGVIRTALHRLVGYAPTFSLAVNNTSITRLIIWGEHTTISFFNDHSHLTGRENLWSF